MAGAAENIGDAVHVTEAALEVIHHLEAAHGPLMFFQSAGCCDGNAPLCLKDGELPPGPHDIKIGDVGGAPYYMDADTYERWGRPRFLLDVSPGAAEGFSLEGVDGVHFVSQTAA